ncbi:MAG: hypothetical protein E6Q66_04645 [Pedobacter sp.]|nr:MAG: hypothetical protein E6Q66_04645 [Pedobacter sp.]
METRANVRQFWKSYKTTLIGITFAVFSAVQPVITTGAIDWKQVFIGAMVGALGFFAKDFNKN